MSGGIRIDRGTAAVPAELRRALLSALRRRLAGRADLTPAQREEAAQQAADQVVAQVRGRLPGGTGRR